MPRKFSLSQEEFDFVAGTKGLYAYGRRFGPPPQACPHMQGPAFYEFVHTPQARECRRCRKMWYCSPECQKALWPAHQQHCVDQRSPLPITAEGLTSMESLSPLPFPTPTMPTSSQSSPYPPLAGTLNLDLSNALSQGIVNKNAIGKKTSYDQLTPGLIALFGRHAFASQRLIWCNTRSNDNATKQARERFASFKSNMPDVMRYAHNKYVSTRMRGAFIVNVDTPCGLSDYMVGDERFNWITFPDAQMTLCVKLQEAIKAYDPSRAFVLVVYALSPDQLSAALWVWTYTDFSRGDPPDLIKVRTHIRQILKDTKRGESYMYQLHKDQNDS
ncbi:unnamed protein product [Rhizoctonia solani]|uniref:MYND-type domain-containing protein n=3 Tax=Rhizoctonia solani TaxID=456999 RepID=A0A8H2WTQ2_9AGAM|nr:MYND finger protein [Rhizoctonia solani AG-3 Rhs1AP]KEP48759.1 MYND finger protein [Rhizoctonia solani 123E]CAE6408225.1 unnamed protein product [Rhizoctonia solani]CAE6506896.1 unnamed protein product [Rhizoctonia solani]